MTNLIHRLVKKILLLCLPNKYVIYRGDKKSNILYLTFDDGPHAEFTDKVLNILKNNAAKATFFLVGDYLHGNAGVVNRIFEQGHFICNHSVTHNEFVNLDTESQIKSIKALDDIFKGIDSVEKRFFRPPRGYVTIKFVLGMLKEAMPIAMWSYDSFDYKNYSVNELFARFEKQPVRNGEIILFHDDNANTVEVLSMLIPYWKKKGFEFKTLRYIK